MNNTTPDSGSEHSDAPVQVMGMDIELLIEFLKTSDLPKVWWQYTHPNEPIKDRQSTVPPGQMKNGV